MEKKNNNNIFKIIGQNMSVFLVFLFALSIFNLIFGNRHIAVVEIAVWIVFSIVMLISRTRKKKALTDYIQNLNYHVDSAAKDSLLHFPMPMTVLRIDGSVMWYNKQFTRLAHQENLFEVYIQDIVPQLKWFEIIKKGDNISEEIEYEGSHYRVLGNVVKSPSKLTDTVKSTEEKDEAYLVLLYWVDITNEYQLAEKLANSKSDVAMIMIDNYDEIMQSLEDSQKPYILAQIERAISTWASSAGGVFKKMDRDRYIFVFHHQYLEGFAKNKFEVLDTVRQLSVDEIKMQMPFTISIGIGTGGETLALNETSARLSIDMALGRGGDQVVVKNSSDFKFYGGKSKEYEKNTRVKTRVMAHALRELIHDSSNVIIMGHANMDLDSLGAAIGLYCAARVRGKRANIIISTKNKSVVNLLTKFLKVEEYKRVFVKKEQVFELMEPNTIVIVVDCHAPNYVEMPELVKSSKKVVVIDHHRRGAEFIENIALVYHEPYASSTCEMVTELLQYMESKVAIGKLEAEALYSGIIMDTKNFNFKTGVRTFEAAGFLRRCGVDTIEVKKLFKNNLSDYKKKVGIVSSANIVYENIAIATCNDLGDDAAVVVAQSADELLNIDGVAASFVLCQLEKSIIVSARSLGDVNVQVVLEKVGGGGHMTLAGAQFADTDLDTAKEKVSAAIAEYINENK